MSGIENKNKKAAAERKKRKREKDLFADVARLVKVPNGASRVAVLEQALTTLIQFQCAVEGVIIGMPFKDIIDPRLDFPEDIFDRE